MNTHIKQPTDTAEHLEVFCRMASKWIQKDYEGSVMPHF